MTRVGLSLPLSCRDRERAGQRKRQTTGYCCTLLQVHRGLIAACKSVFQNSILISCRCRMFSFFFFSPPTFYTQIGFGFIRLTFEALINHSKSSCNRIACGFFGCNCQLANCNANCNCQPIGCCCCRLSDIRTILNRKFKSSKQTLKECRDKRPKNVKQKKNQMKKKKRQQQLSKFVHQHK